MLSRKKKPPITTPSLGKGETVIPHYPASIWFELPAACRQNVCDYCGCEIQRTGKPTCKQCGAPIKGRQDTFDAHWRHQLAATLGEGG